MTHTLHSPSGLFYASILMGFWSGQADGADAQPLATPPYYGQAYNLKASESRDLLYTEMHQESFANGQKVAIYSRFQDPHGRPIAERHLDFSRSATQPDYAFQDFRSGYEEGAKVSGSQVRVFYRDSWTSPMREKTLTVPEPYVIDGGFNAFLKQNWNSLMSGKRVRFNFVAPARLDYYGFAAYEDPRRVPKGAADKAFVVEVDNALLRLLVSPIVVTYDTSTRMMTRYQGISNISDAKGKSLKVSIVYPKTGP